MNKKYCQRCNRMKEFGKRDYYLCDDCYRELDDNDELDDLEVISFNDRD